MVVPTQITDHGDDLNQSPSGDLDLQQSGGAGDMDMGSTKYKFETRLIEANTNPCLEESNALLKDYLPRMADDMLKIVLDPLFGTQTHQLERGNTDAYTYPVEGYSENDSMWTLI